MHLVPGRDRCPGHLQREVDALPAKHPEVVAGFSVVRDETQRLAPEVGHGLDVGTVHDRASDADPHGPRLAQQRAARSATGSRVSRSRHVLHRALRHVVLPLAVRLHADHDLRMDRLRDRPSRGGADRARAGRARRPLRPARTGAERGRLPGPRQRPPGSWPVGGLRGRPGQLRVRRFRRDSSQTPRRTARTIAAHHEDLPLFLVAHSMGSFAAQSVLLDHSEQYAGVVLSGSTALDVLAQSLAESEGPGGLEAFNAGFEHRTGYEWLSRDESEVDAYVADPLCGFDVPEDAIPQMFADAQRLADHEDAERASARTCRSSSSPVEADPLSGGGQLVELLGQRYRDAGLARRDHAHLPRGAPRDLQRDQPGRDHGRRRGLVAGAQLTGPAPARPVDQAGTAWRRCCARTPPMIRASESGSCSIGRWPVPSSSACSTPQTLGERPLQLDRQVAVGSVVQT